MEYTLLNTINSPEDLKNLKISELDSLSSDIRTFILERVSKTGGHLASNLGVVELTLGLHYVFESPQDKILWDVGHQSYIHKILTGRKDKFDTLRQWKGISGFPKPNESDHDVFGTGHSSTAISAALGMARARDISNEAYHVLAIVGDGALTGGMAFEALNDAGHSGNNLIVILNDNEMSISKNVGALAGHLSKVRSSSEYISLKKKTQNILGKIPWAGNSIAKGLELSKKGFKSMLVPGMFFEEMGFKYLGPIDGHSIHSVVRVLRQASMMEGPIIIHVITQKGQGYKSAENNPEFFHGVAPFDIETGEINKEGKGKSFSSIYGEKLIEMAGKDPRVVAITAAMPESTGLMDFKRTYPERFFDVGIAEQHAVTMAAGLAATGLKPFVSIYSTFLQRAYDQILHDVCIQDLPVVFGVDRGGLVGKDGETHHGVFDISFLRHIPNMTILAPKCIDEFIPMMDFALDYPGPLALRYPRGYIDYNKSPFTPKTVTENFLSWETLTRGKDCCIISFGTMLWSALEALKLLRRAGIYPHIVNARSIKPMDEKAIKDIAQNHKLIITIEDNVIAGGFGSGFNEHVINKNYNIKVLNLGIPDKFIKQGNIEELHETLNLDPAGIAQQIKEFIMNKAGDKVNVQSI